MDVFDKFQNDYQLRRDHIARALEWGGVLCPDRAIIDEVYDHITKNSSLKQHEFQKLAEIYLQAQADKYTEAFAECDADGSGFVDAQQLATLLRRFGVEPLMHVLEEIIDEVDVESRGALDIQEFDAVMEMLRVREGFSKREYEEFMAAYDFFDREGTGSVDTNELSSILAVLGYCVEASATKRVAMEVDRL